MSNRQSPTNSKSKSCSYREDQNQSRSSRELEEIQRQLEEEIATSERLLMPSSSSASRSRGSRSRRNESGCEESQSQHGSRRAPSSHHTSNLRLPSPPQHSPSSYATWEEPKSQRVSSSRSPTNQASYRRMSPSQYNDCEDPQSQRASPRRTPSVSQSSNRRTPSPSHHSPSHHSPSHHSPSLHSPSHHSPSHPAFSECEESQSQKVLFARSIESADTSYRRLPSPSHYTPTQNNECEDHPSQGVPPGRSPPFSQTSNRRLGSPSPACASSRSMSSRVSQKTSSRHVNPESSRSRADYSTPQERGVPFTGRNMSCNNVMSPGDENYSPYEAGLPSGANGLQNGLQNGLENGEENGYNHSGGFSSIGHSDLSEANNLSLSLNMPPSRHNTTEHSSIHVSPCGSPRNSPPPPSVSPNFMPCVEPPSMSKSKSPCKEESSRCGDVMEKPSSKCESRNTNHGHSNCRKNVGQRCAREIFPAEHHSPHGSHRSPANRPQRNDGLTPGVSPITPSPNQMHRHGQHPFRGQDGHQGHHGHDAGESPEVIFQDEKAEAALAHLSQLKQPSPAKTFKVNRSPDVMAAYSCSPKGKPRLPEMPCLEQEEIDELINCEKQDVDFAMYLTSEARKTYKKPCPKQQKAQMNVKSLMKAYSSQTCEEKNYSPLEHPDPDDISPEVAANMMFTQEKGIKMDACPLETVAHLFPSEKSALSRVPRSTISIVDPSQRENMVEKSASVPSDGVSDSAYTRKMKEKGEEGSNQRSFDGEPSGSQSKREYVLVAEKPQRFNKIQFRGGNLPSWFPGYFSAFPDEDGNLKQISSANGILLKAWLHSNPRNLPPNDVIVLD